MKRLVVTLAVLGALLAGSLYPDRVVAQEAVPEQSSLLTACQSARALANIAHLNVSRCRKVAVVEEGNTALVTVKVWVDGQGIFLVSVGLMKTQWTQQAIVVNPA